MFLVHLIIYSTCKGKIPLVYITWSKSGTNYYAISSLYVYFNNALIVFVLVRTGHRCELIRLFPFILLLHDQQVFAIVLFSFFV